MNPLALLSTLATPERLNRMATIAVFLTFTSLIFVSGYLIGKMKTQARYEQLISEERIAALEAVTETYAMLMGMEKRHAQDTEKLEAGLGRLDRSITRSVDSILKANPELARWYREPINDLQHTVMYADADRLLREAGKIGTAADTNATATGNRVANP